MFNRFLVFLVLVFFAGVLRFYCLGEWSFGFDELFTTLETKIFFGEVPVPDEYLKNGKTQPEETQLYRLPQMMFVSYVIHWSDYKLFGTNEFGSRVLMAVLGTLSIGVIFIMTRSIFGFVGALILSLLFLVLPEHILQSQNNRFYIQSFFLISVVLIWGGYVAVWRSVFAAVWLGVAAVLMVFVNVFGGIIWGGLLGAVVVDMICSKNTVDKNLYPSCFKIPETAHASVASRNGCSGAKPTGFGIAKNNLKIILILSVWSIVLLLIAFFNILPFASSWNKSLSWGYTPIHSAMAFINIIGWSLFLFSILGSFILLFRVNISGNGYWLSCVLFCGFAILVLPMKIVYNPQYGILFIFPFIVTAAIFIREIYFLILRSAIPYKRIFCVVWVCVCTLLNLPSLVSYYQDGGRFDNRAAFNYIADKWQNGDGITGIQMGSAKYYIPDKTPRFPLRPDPDRSIKELQTILEQNKNNSGQLWIVLPSSRGGLDNKLLKWLGQNATFEHRFTKKRYDHIENNIDIYRCQYKK
ncbi:MAG: hypothetical protein LBJ00_01545 [Planctomycetaceae bacterium]|nr:hypothetical protein [Planctomycetaceae bacterium]